MMRRWPWSDAQPHSRAPSRRVPPPGRGTTACVSMGGAPGTSVTRGAPSSQASSACKASLASDSSTGTCSTSASNAGFERTMRPLSS